MGDEVVDALRDLVDALERNRGRIDQVLARADELIRERESGRSWREAVSGGDQPMIVGILGQNLDELYTAGGRLRRLLAKTLHDEGLSMEQIARLFGVTRQRVSALLRGEQDRTTDLREVGADARSS
jgi:hypothetical protein